MKPIYCFLLSNIFFLFSCSHQENKNHAGEKIVLPGKMEVYNPYVTDVNGRLLQDSRKPFKIYTTINASCATCLPKLEKWDKFRLQNPDSGNVAIIPICRSEDRFELLKFLFENNKLEKIGLSLRLDYEDSFLIRNKALVKFGELTALTDAEDHVLFTGDPLLSNKDRENFIKFMHKLVSRP
jgi:hypothetical protein